MPDSSTAPGTGYDGDESTTHRPWAAQNTAYVAASFVAFGLLTSFGLPRRDSDGETSPGSAEGHESANAPWQPGRRPVSSATSGFG